MIDAVTIFDTLALSCWDGEGGAGPPGARATTIDLEPTPAREFVRTPCLRLTRLDSTTVPGLATRLTP